MPPQDYSPLTYNNRLEYSCKCDIVQDPFHHPDQPHERAITEALLIQRAQRTAPKPRAADYPQAARTIPLRARRQQRCTRCVRGARRSAQRLGQWGEGGGGGTTAIEKSLLGTYIFKFSRLRRGIRCDFQ